MSLNFSDYLDAEWMPALGCTEPASIALAAATAAAQAEGEILRIQISCDPGTFKNCFAVGIPSSQGKTGLLWAAALGALTADPNVGLQAFRAITTAMLQAAQQLLARQLVSADADADKCQLWIDCHVQRAGGAGRAVIAGSHTHVVRIERDERVLLDSETRANSGDAPSMRQRIAGLSLNQLIDIASSIDERERRRLDEGIALNMAICRFGETLFPEGFAIRGPDDVHGRAARLVCGGVYARMSGADFTVMSLAGSGNKGITASVPLIMWAEQLRARREKMLEALALTALMTSAVTWRLGTLSAMCGCANAAGIGLATGKVWLDGGNAADIGRAVNNMVGNIAGMICDGAKIGCGMKALTAVDAAARSAELALAGMGIPVTDGIVGADSNSSLANLGRIATDGMFSADSEILAIMRAKLLPENG